MGDCRIIEVTHNKHVCPECGHLVNLLFFDGKPLVGQEINCGNCDSSLVFRD